MKESVKFGRAMGNACGRSQAARVRQGASFAALKPLFNQLRHLQGSAGGNTPDPTSPDDANVTCAEVAPRAALKPNTR